MPHPFPLASVFTGGMRRDVDRTELPGGSAYNMVDFIPDEIQAITASRGGWTYAGGAMTAVTNVYEIGYWTNETAPASSKVVAATSDGKLWNPVTATSLGTLAVGYAASPPFYHRGKLIFPNGLFGAGAALQNYYDGATTGLLASGPTSGQQLTVGCAFKDHAVLANTVQGVQRVHFSAAGDPTTWDLSFGWWDTSGPVTAVIPLLSGLLICHASSTERLRGTTPPPGSDMTLEPFAGVGCIDPHTVASWKNAAVFASAQGIYLTDGATVVDLTEQAQIKTYWQSLMSGYSAPTMNAGYASTDWRIAAGVYRDHYIISINHGSTLVDCLCISLPNRTAWRFTNLHGSCFVRIDSQQQEKLYMGLYNAGRVAELSSLWSPSASVKQDGDGTNPTPIVETAMYRGYDRLHRRWIESMGKQKWRWGYVDYDLRDAATDNPTAALSYCTTPDGAYTQAGLTLPETTKISRVRRALNPTQGGATRSQMMGFKFAVTGPSASAKLYTLESDFSPIRIGAL